MMKIEIFKNELDVCKYFTVWTHCKCISVIYKDEKFIAFYYEI